MIEKWKSQKIEHRKIETSKNLRSKNRTSHNRNDRKKFTIRNLSIEKNWNYRKSKWPKIEMTKNRNYRKSNWSKIEIIENRNDRKSKWSKIEMIENLRLNQKIVHEIISKVSWPQLKVEKKSAIDLKKNPAKKINKTINVWFNSRINSVFGPSESGGMGHNFFLLHICPFHNSSKTKKWW